MSLFSHANSNNMQNAYINHTALRNDNVHIIRNNKPEDLRNHITACLNEIHQMVHELDEEQKAIINIGAKHDTISHILFTTAIIAHLHKAYKNRLLFARERSHHDANPNQHAAASINSAFYIPEAPYSNAYLFDFLQDNILIPFLTTL